MRQSYGLTWILTIMFTFTMIFVSFIALSLNFMKSYRLKNHVVTIAENYEGFTKGSNGKDGSIKIINNYLKYNAYSAKGSCPEGSYGMPTLENDGIFVTPAEGEKYYYCVGFDSASTSANPFQGRFNITLFFKFNLPLLGDLFTFRVDGETIVLRNPIPNYMQDING